jgi:methylmalonyl-CoA mutase
VTDLGDAGFASSLAVADGRLVHAAGGSEAQELAFVLACAVAYWRALERAGRPLAQAAQSVAVRLAADTDQFLTIAKFRAVRLLLNRLHEACGLSPVPLHVTGETAWRMMTRRDPHVNLVRATVAAFAAAVGGADAITVLPFPAALGVPDPMADRLARNTQLILAEESNIAKVIDPGAGSGVIESATDQLCAAAWALFQDFEKSGGVDRAIESGDFARQVEAVRVERERALVAGSEAIVGVTAFPNRDEPVVVDTGNLIAREPPAGSVRFPPLAPMRLAQAFE